MASVIKFGDDGEIILPTPRIKRVVVRFPSLVEQAKGMTEVPRAVRLKEKVIFDARTMTQVGVKK